MPINFIHKNVSSISQFVIFRFMEGIIRIRDGSIYLSVWRKIKLSDPISIV